MSGLIEEQVLEKLQERVKKLLEERSFLADMRAEVLDSQREVDRHLDECVATARFFEVHIDIPVSLPNKGGQDMKYRSVRDIVLMCVKEAGDTGMKAHQIQDYYEQVNGNIIYHKTIGMTLYRLLKEGVVSRKGHVWFISEGEV